MMLSQPMNIYLIMYYVLLFEQSILLIRVNF